MGRRRYAVVVAALAAATLAGGINADAAPAKSVKPVRVYVDAPAAAALAADPGALFTSMPPTRVLDTRFGTGTGGATSPLGPRDVIAVDLSSVVPAGAEAVVLNLAGTEATGNTFVTAYPTGIDRPVPASNLNLVPGQTRSSAVTVALTDLRSLNLYNNAGSTHLIADVSGYYIANNGNEFHTQPPTRVLDTRFGTGTGGSTSPVPSHATLTLDLSGQVPPTATAVTFNLAGTDGTGNTFITAFPAGGPVPTAANLNLTPGETAPNLVTVQLSADKRVGLFNNFGTTHLIADLAGYFAPDQGPDDGGLPFFVTTPFRLFDSRLETGPITPDTPLELIFSGFPPNTKSMVASLAGTEPTTSMHVTAWPAGSAQPNTSNLNLVAGQTAANLITVEVGPSPEPDFQFSLFFRNSAGSVHLILDLAGVFAPPIP